MLFVFLPWNCAAVLVKRCHYRFCTILSCLQGLIQGYTKISGTNSTVGFCSTADTQLKKQQGAVMSHTGVQLNVGF